MIDDSDAVVPAPDLDLEYEDRSRTPPPRDPEEDAEWRSEFRSYLEDPGVSRLRRWWLRVTIGLWLHRA